MADEAPASSDDPSPSSAAAGAVAAGINPDASGLGSMLAGLVAVAPQACLACLARAGVEALEACAPPPPGAPRAVRLALAASALPGLDLACAALARLAEEGGGDAADARASPAAVTAAALARLCRAPTWPAPAARAVEALRSLPALTPAQAGAIADRALAECGGVRGSDRGQRATLGDLTDLPAVLHQLLLLRPAAGARAALAGAVDLLDAAAGSASASPSSASSMATAATVVLEAERSAAAAPDAARGWLAGLAARASAGPHGAAVLLAIASGVPRLAGPALDEVRACLGRAYKADGVRAASRWGAASPEPSAGSFPSSASLEAALLAVAGGSAAGWERGLPAVLALVDALVDGVPDKATVRADGGGEDADEPTDLPPATRAGRLGVRLAVAAFGAAPSPAARAQIFNLCIARLASSGVGSGAGGPTGAALAPPAPAALATSSLTGKPGHWVAALAGVAASHAADLAAHHAGAVRAALELCGALPAATSAALLTALWPAARAAPSARDAAALSLRKAAFSREASARAAAATGMLALSLHELTAPPPAPTRPHLADGAGPSQAHFQPLATPASASASSTSSLSGSLQELTGFLRRCLSQQAGVRAALYDGMPALVAADGGDGAAEALAGLLMPQLARVAPPAGGCGGGAPASTLPLCLDLAVVQAGDGLATVVEPLPRLLACVRRVCLLAGAGCVAAGKDGGISGPHGRAAARVGAGLPPSPPPATPRPGGAVAALASAFAATKAAVLGSVLEDYDLDKAADWGLGGGGPATRGRAAALAGVLEVFMEDSLAGAAGGGCPPADASDQISAAFSLHDRLRDLGASAAEAEGGGGAAEAATATAAAATSKKRGRADAAASSSAPLPALSPWAAAALLCVVAEDTMPSPGDGRGVPLDGEGAGGGAQGDAAPPLPSAQLSLDPGARLARSPRFQAFTLRVARALVGAGAGSAEPASVSARAALGPPLLRAGTLVATAFARGGGPACGGCGGGGGGGAGAAAAAAAKDDALLVSLGVDCLVALLDAPASRAEARRLVDAASGGVGSGSTEGGGGGAATPASPATALSPASCLHPLSRTLDLLVAGGCWKEAAGLADALARLARRPGVLSPAGRGVLRGAAAGGLGGGVAGASSPAVRGLAGLLLATAPGPGDDATDALRLAEAAVAALKGDAGAVPSTAPGPGPQPFSLTLPAITPRTAAAVAGVALDAALAACADVDWAFATARAASRTTAASPPSTHRLMVGGGGRGQSPGSALPAAAALDAASCARLGAWLPPIAAVAGGGLCHAAPRLGEKALRAVLAAYRSLSAGAARVGEASKAGDGVSTGGGGGHAPRPPPALSPTFLAMVAAAHKALTPAAYALLTDAENHAAGGGGGGGHTARAPAVVFAAEDFERRLIRLGGAAGGCGGADLLRGSRRATARDFKIKLGPAAPQVTGGTA